VVQLRASVVRDQRLIAQRPFTARRPSPAPDAAGAAAALAQASDALLDEIVVWTAATMSK
jgi:cholesterol transport system auxiliary component